VQSSDVLLVTPSAAERKRVIDSESPVVTLAFRPDARSVEQLAVLIARRSAAPVSRDFDALSRKARGSR